MNSQAHKISPPGTSIHVASCHPGPIAKPNIATSVGEHLGIGIDIFDQKALLGFIMLSKIASGLCLEISFRKPSVDRSSPPTCHEPLLFVTSVFAPWRIAVLLCLNIFSSGGNEHRGRTAACHPCKQTRLRLTPFVYHLLDPSLKFHELRSKLHMARPHPLARARERDSNHVVLCVCITMFLQLRRSC